MEPFDLMSLAKKLPLEKIYGDVLQPGCKQVGMALETVVGLVNTLLLPLKILNEKSAEKFRIHMENYRQKMARIPEEKVLPVIPELGIPILDRFTYVSDETLGELYENLLVSASDEDSVDSAHPGFIGVIEQLSPDEANLLLEFRNRDLVQWCYGTATSRRTGEHVEFGQKYGQLASASLKFPQNMEVYFANLQGLGILDRTEGNRSDAERRDLSAIQGRVITEFQEIGGERDWSLDHQLVSGHARITAFGRMFLKACLR